MAKMFGRSVQEYCVIIIHIVQLVGSEMFVYWTVVRRRTSNTGRCIRNITTGKTVPGNRLILSFPSASALTRETLPLLTPFIRTWWADNPSSPVLPHAHKLAASVTLQVSRVCDSFRKALKYAGAQVPTDHMRKFRTRYEGHITKKKVSQYLHYSHQHTSTLLGWFNSFVEVKFFPTHTTKLYGQNKDMEPLILNIGTWWSAQLHAAPALLPRKEPRNPLTRGLCRPQRGSRHFGEEIRIPNCPARSLVTMPTEISRLLLLCKPLKLFWHFVREFLIFKWKFKKWLML